MSHVRAPAELVEVDRALGDERIGREAESVDAVAHELHRAADDRGDRLLRRGVEDVDVVEAEFAEQLEVAPVLVVLGGVVLADEADGLLAAPAPALEALDVRDVRRKGEESEEQVIIVGDRQLLDALLPDAAATPAAIDAVEDPIDRAALEDSRGDYVDQADLRPDVLELVLEGVPLARDHVALRVHQHPGVVPSGHPGVSRHSAVFMTIEAWGKQRTVENPCERTTLAGGVVSRQDTRSGCCHRPRRGRSVEAPCRGASGSGCTCRRSSAA